MRVLNTAQSNMRFQFHKGTIRTKINTLEKDKESNFNSIKVRLEQCELNLPLDAVKFQFHKGTIRTNPSPRSAKS